VTQSTATYNPAQKYDVKTYDIEYRVSGGSKWLARIYQPQGAGVFPAFLDIHGGAWQGGSHLDGEYVDRNLAESGLVVAAIDFRVAPEHPYPAQVSDVNYGIRWWKANAGDYNGDASKLGALGISSGGHTTMLSAMRPFDERYASEPLPGNPDVDATLDYYIGASPVLDSYGRYVYAKESGNERLASGSTSYFLTEETMKEASPQIILERGEKVHLPPALVIHGTSDANVPNHIPTRFEEAYRVAGGSIELKLFTNMPHSFVRTPGPEADEAIGMMKEFIARQLTA
jgi:acetyl esterase/lipase